MIREEKKKKKKKKKKKRHIPGSTFGHSSYLHNEQVV
jgi:hypothetical protein